MQSMVVSALPDHWSLPADEGCLLKPQVCGSIWEHLQWRGSNFSLPSHYKFKILHELSIFYRFFFHHSCCEVGKGWEGTLQHSHSGHQHIPHPKTQAVLNWSSTWKIWFLWVKIQEEWLMNSRQRKPSRQASRLDSDPLSLTGRGSQIKSPLIRETFKWKLVGLLRDEVMENIYCPAYFLWTEFTDSRSNRTVQDLPCVSLRKEPMSQHWFGHRKVLERPAWKLASFSQKDWFEDSEEIKNCRIALDVVSCMMLQNICIHDVKERYRMGK